MSDQPAGPEATPSHAAHPSPGQLSADGAFYWDGSAWKSTLSPDGGHRWNGSAWLPTGVVPAPPPGVYVLAPPRRSRAGLWIALVLVLLLFGGCVVAAAAVAGAASGSKTVFPSSGPAGQACVQPCANVGGWIVQVSEFKFGAAAGADFIKPEAGNVFVTLNVTFLNRTGKEQHANPLQFVLKDGAGIKHAIEMIGSCSSWSAVNLTSGAIFGPRCLAFQAAASPPSNIVLVWTPDLFGGDHNIKVA